MKKVIISVLCMILLFTATGCGPNSNIEVEVPQQTIELNTPGPNPLVDQPGGNERVAGLGQGLWHGLIAPVTLVLSFFNHSIQMYEVHNTGEEYNLGYLVGVAIIFLLLGITGRRWR